jgi:hypothetical protein
MKPTMARERRALVKVYWKKEMVEKAIIRISHKFTC